MSQDIGHQRECKVNLPSGKRIYSWTYGPKAARGACHRWRMFVKEDRKVKKEEVTVARRSHNRLYSRGSRRYRDSEGEPSDSSKSPTPDHRHRCDPLESNNSPPWGGFRSQKRLRGRSYWPMDAPKGFWSTKYSGLPYKKTDYIHTSRPTGRIDSRLWKYLTWCLLAASREISKICKFICSISNWMGLIS